MAFNARNSAKVGVRTTAMLAKMFNSYTTMKANDTEPEIFKDEDACVLFWDSSSIYPDQDQIFDPANWGLIYKQYVAPATNPINNTVTASTGTSTVQASNTNASTTTASGSGAAASVPKANVERIAQAIEKVIAPASKHKEEVFNHNALPDEVRIRYFNKLSPDTVLIESDLTKFKNDLTKYNGNTHALNFVRFPKDTYSSFIIMRDGTMFKYINHQDDKQRESFLKNFPKLKGFDPMNFYYWHLELESLSYSKNGWVHPYHLKYLGCPDRRGFVLGDPEKNQDIDLHCDYVDACHWLSPLLFQGLSKEGVLPNKKAKDLLAVSNGCGFIFLHSCHMALNPYMMEDRMDLIKRFPAQEGSTFPEYCLRVDFFHAMEGIIDNVEVDYSKTNPQNRFIKGMDYSEEIWSAVEEARDSNIKRKKERFLGAQFRNSVGTLQDQIVKSAKSESISRSYNRRTQPFKRSPELQ